MTTTARSDADFVQDVQRIATEVAAPHAEDVDRRGRFPAEAIEALRAGGALAAGVGDGGVGLHALADACSQLARACSSTAMIFAMHQIQLLTIARHADAGSWLEAYVREAADAQPLIASITSEVGTGGDMGRSIAALTGTDDGACSFRKTAPTVSYGAHADDFLTTLRRTPDAAPNDQVLALSRRAQTELAPLAEWDALGMRGTCSPGFEVEAGFPAAQVLATPFAEVAAQSMVPISHVLWSHVWLGIAGEAYERARRFVRASSRGHGERQAPDALSHASAALTQLRATVRWGLDEFVAGDDADREGLSTLGAAVRFNNLKLAASEQAATVCHLALRVCGMQGYRNDTPYSVGRQLRDALSGALMVANDRIHAVDAGMLPLTREA